MELITNMHEIAVAVDAAAAAAVGAAAAADRLVSGNRGVVPLSATGTLVARRDPR